jgi:hypothetical protein
MKRWLILIAIPISTLLILVKLDSSYIHSSRFSLYESGNYGVAAGSGGCSAPNLSIDPSFQCLSKPPIGPNPLVFYACVIIFVISIFLDFLYYKRSKNKHPNSG